MVRIKRSTCPVLGPTRKRQLFCKQNNSTHIQQQAGYLRHDTEAERKILSALYHHELTLYKNFFQPVIKLESKTRVKGKIKKKYDRTKTPYARLMKSNKTSSTRKAELRQIYESLNPAELKRRIEKRLALLQKVHDQKKGRSEEVIPELSPAVLVSKLIIQPKRIQYHS